LSFLEFIPEVCFEILKRLDRRSFISGLNKINQNFFYLSSHYSVLFLLSWMKKSENLSSSYTKILATFRRTSIYSQQELSFFLFVKSCGHFILFQSDQFIKIVKEKKILFSLIDKDQSRTHQDQQVFLIRTEKKFLLKR